MNGESAYGGEMNELALFESALRAAVPTQPDPRLGVVLVPRLAEAARASTVEAETHAVRRGLRSRRGLVARVGIAVALVPLVLAGLAFAGVTVPQPARSVFHAVGITLPNQSAKHSHPSSPTTTGEQSSGEGTRRHEPVAEHGQLSGGPPARTGAARQGEGQGDRPHPGQGDRSQRPRAPGSLRADGAARAVQLRWQRQRQRRGQGAHEDLPCPYHDAAWPHEDSTGPHEDSTGPLQVGWLLQGWRRGLDEGPHPAGARAGRHRCGAGAPGGAGLGPRSGHYRPGAARARPARSSTRSPSTSSGRPQPSTFSC